MVPIPCLFDAQGGPWNLVSLGTALPAASRRRRSRELSRPRSDKLSQRVVARGVGRGTNRECRTRTVNPPPQRSATQAGTGSARYQWRKSRLDKLRSHERICLEAHTQDSGLSFGLKLTHCFMLMTWLFSVSRSIRAAVR